MTVTAGGSDQEPGAGLGPGKWRNTYGLGGPILPCLMSEGLHRKMGQPPSRQRRTCFLRQWQVLPRIWVTTESVTGLGRDFPGRTFYILQDRLLKDRQLSQEDDPPREVQVRTCVPSCAHPALQAGRPQAPQPQAWAGTPAAKDTGPSPSDSGATWWVWWGTGPMEVALTYAPPLPSLPAVHPGPQPLLSLCCVSPETVVLASSGDIYLLAVPDSRWRPESPQWPPDRHGPEVRAPGPAC